MGDVAQILGLSSASSAPSATSTDAVTKELQQLKPTGGLTPTKTHKKLKKLTGMHREVVDLLEHNHRVNHALYPSVNKLTLYQKWKERKDIPAVKWSRQSFTNPARGEDDPLTLSHWVKSHLPPSEYVFARFNVQCDVFEYTDAEYDAVLSNHIDPLYPSKWTRAETDLLIELCKKYDLRWIIIADQFNLHPIMIDSVITRSVEDLKYRYYEVIRLITLYKNKTVQEPSLEAEAGTSVPEETNVPTGTKIEIPYRFNVTYEKQRKRQLELAFNRTTEEEIELQQLQDELKTVETQLKKVSMKMDPKKKKETSLFSFQEQIRPSGVYLRSTTLALPSAALNAKLIKKMELLLEEMGVPLRPMPTKWTCEAFDALRQEIIGLFTLQKHLGTKQTEIEALKERFLSLTGTPYEPITSDVRRIKGRGTVGASGTVVEPIPTSQSISKGNALKATEKGNKRRGSTVISGIPSKRNKKIL